jgi:protoporphyrinogen oxidase
MILGAGVTGLACGLASGLPIYEMNEAPGGICASYYIVPGEGQRLHCAPRDEEAYRFEIGGGHWLWGGDPLILRFLRSVTEFKSYGRRSGVYLPDPDVIVPYPIQNHLGYLGPDTAIQALREMCTANSGSHSAATMADWLQASFGPTLCRIFFDPFHELYTAGLWRELAPQDDLKSPLDLTLAIKGAFKREAQTAGYNVNFLYPRQGLNVVAQRMAQRCKVQYGHRVREICVKQKAVTFVDGTTQPFEALLCTLPLNTTLRLVGLELNCKPDPYTSVMVINIGARKGLRCPEEHWLYVPRSKAGFHRVGFYSNVDSSFLPRSAREERSRVSVYVEKAFQGGQQLTTQQTKEFTQTIVEELRTWGWIEDVEVADPTWIETAYTWVWPGSQWRQKAIEMLERHGIYQLGRYGRWAPQLTDQGIAQSIRDGLWAGASFKEFA